MADKIQNNEERLRRHQEFMANYFPYILGMGLLLLIFRPYVSGFITF